MRRQEDEEDEERRQYLQQVWELAGNALSAADALSSVLSLRLRAPEPEVEAAEEKGDDGATAEGGGGDDDDNDDDGNSPPPAADDAPADEAGPPPEGQDGQQEDDQEPLDKKSLIRARARARAKRQLEVRAAGPEPQGSCQSPASAPRSPTWARSATGGGSPRCLAPRPLDCLPSRGGSVSGGDAFPRGLRFAGRGGRDCGTPVAADGDEGRRGNGISPNRPPRRAHAQGPPTLPWPCCAGCAWQWG